MPLSIVSGSHFYHASVPATGTVALPSVFLGAGYSIVIDASVGNADGVSSVNGQSGSVGNADGVSSVLGISHKQIPPLQCIVPYDVHVRRTGLDYAQQFLRLLPDGQAWPRSGQSTLVQTVDGLCDYWGFVDGRAADLLEIESDPRTTTELLPDWERNWGLPDPCVQAPQSIEARRIALVLKMTMLGGQSRAFFEGVAEALGYTITITEFLPYICGISRVGDTRSVLDNPDSPNEYMWQLGPPEIRYYWTVHVNGITLYYFHTGLGECGVDRLLSFGTAEDLVCMLERWKPAHTEIVFDYSSVGASDFSQSYNSGYIAIPMG